MTIWRRVLAFVAVAAFAGAGILAAATASAEITNPNGVAVIIGNKTYEHGLPEVTYAGNDADAFRAYVLEVLGYDPANIIDLPNTTEADFRATFGNNETHRGRQWRLVDAGISEVVVFYSGHGVPGADRRQYLLPVDADPEVPELNGYALVLLYENLVLLEARSVAVYLDACFSGDSFGGKLSRWSGFGLGPPLPAGAGDFGVLTAAASNQVAVWDDEAEHGVFTKHLLDALYGAADAGETDNEITLAEVKAYLDLHMTPAAKGIGREQNASQGGANPDMVLAALPDEPVPPPPPPLPPLEVLDAEMFALANVNVRAGPTTQTEKLTTIAIGAPVAVVGKTGDWFQVALANGGVGYILGRYLGDAAQPQPPATETGLNPGDVFRECDVCPEMVVIPAGRFTMGSPAGEEGRYDDEGPQHTVAISRPFAVGRFEVTRSEFAAFVTAARHSMTGGCWVYDGEWNKEASRNWASPGFSQTDRDPVVCVNWADAQAYIDWLNSRAARQVAGAGGFGAGGGPYRLLTEAEWEYAARGGTTTARFWGDSPDLACRYGNVADQTAKERFTGWTVHNCRDGGVYTAPVGGFLANGFGLHDMLGNVWEWVEDCWHGDYNGAPVADEAWVTSGDCDKGALRGGSWDGKPVVVRSAGRGRNSSENRGSDGGFRVARTL